MVMFVKRDDTVGEAEEMIETERLRFRRYTLNDLDFYASLLADPEVMRFIGEGKPRSWAEAKQRLPLLIGQYETHKGMGLMLITRKADGALLGHAGVVPQTIEGAHESEIGYWIAREHWGNGYATEAACAFRDYAVQQLGKKRLVSIIQFKNDASINVAKKMGMRFERDVHFHSKHVALYALQSS